MTDIQQRLAALVSEAPPESPTPAATGEDQIEQSDKQQETPKGDTESELKRRRKMKLGEHEIEIEILSDDPDLIDLVPKGLQMEADYTRKTMKLAEELKAARKELETFRGKVSDLEVALNLDVENLESQEMQELKEIDPEEYLKKYESAKKKAERLQKYKSELYERDLKAQQEYAQAEISRWTDAVPDWLDDNVKMNEIKMISASLKDAGFTDQEMEGMFDHRLIKQLRKAALYDKIKSQKVEAKEQKVKPTKAIKSTSSEDDAPSAYQQARSKLKQSGKLSDAQAAISKLISGG